tara:strand:- start:5444 stop:6337 length:894 start_codon:yes stop_codon:yes gene_type:complete
VERILFFGGSGKLGKNWVDFLIKNKSEVTVNVNRNSFKVRKNLVQRKFKFENEKKIINYCIKNKISLIINCIGLSNVEESEKNNKLAKYLNYQIPIKLYKISKKLNIYFLHISTDMLFDGKYSGKYSEISKCKSLNYYSKTKIDAENKIKTYPKSLIIRTNFFGFSSNNNMTITDKIIAEQKSGKITYLWKDIFFTPIYLKTLIYFLDLLIKNKNSGTFNISSDEKISKFDFGKKVLEKLKIKHKIKANLFNKSSFVLRPKNMSLSNKKIKKLFPKEASKLKINNQINLFANDYFKK